MAEWVFRNLEALLPQLEELELCGIFSREEIREVVRRRRRHEYSMRRRPPQKEDYLRAIQYEISLDLLRKRRKKKLGITGTSKDAEFGIHSRINGLFQRALQKFKADIKLWLQFIAFSKRCHHWASLNKTFGKVLAIHPHKPGLWVMAAKFKFEEMKDSAAARVLLQQGLRANKTSKHLWNEYFRMELMHTDKIRKRRSLLGLDPEEDDRVANVTDDFLTYKAAMVVFSQATKAIPDDIEFVSHFFQFCNFLRTLRNVSKRYDNIKEDFSAHPLCWDALARRQWIGVNTASLTDSQVGELEEGIVGVFMEGLGSIGEPDLSCQLWQKFIDWCLERVQDEASSEEMQSQAIQRLLRAFMEAFESGATLEQLYLQCLDSLQGLGLSELAHELSVTASLSHPHSTALWQTRLKCFSVCNHGNKTYLSTLNQLCREAIEKLPEESSLPVWRYWLEESISCGESEKDIEDIFQAAVKCRADAVSSVLCMQYIDWAMVTGGHKRARRVYRRFLKLDRPVPYCVYEKCFEVEKAIEAPSMKHLRDLFEKAVIDYGQDNPGLWLDYVSVEMTMKKGALENVGKLHWRAMNTLHPHLCGEFVEQYTLMQNA